MLIAAARDGGREGEDVPVFYIYNSLNCGFYFACNRPLSVVEHLSNLDVKLDVVGVFGGHDNRRIFLTIAIAASLIMYFCVFGLGVGPFFWDIDVGCFYGRSYEMIIHDQLFLHISFLL